MGQKLYEKTEAGGIRFTSHRMGQVRVPNYVYDIWLPILGADGVAVYSVYCRLERQDVVKAITQADIAKACRIGVAKLGKINDKLQECGFVRITKPTGHKRLMHWTTEIEVFEAPVEVPAEIIEKYGHPQGYETLSTWLVAPEIPNGISGNTNQSLDEIPNGISNVVSLGLNTLEDTGSPASPVSSDADDFERCFGEPPNRPERKKHPDPIGEVQEAHSRMVQRDHARPEDVVTQLYCEHTGMKDPPEGKREKIACEFARIIGNWGGATPEQAALAWRAYCQENDWREINLWYKSFEDGYGQKLQAVKDGTLTARDCEPEGSRMRVAI